MVFRGLFHVKLLGTPLLLCAISLFFWSVPVEQGWAAVVKLGQSYGSVYSKPSTFVLLLVLALFACGEDDQDQIGY